MGRKVKGFVELWILKLIGIALIIAAVGYGVHRYNQYHVEKGKAEVAAQWSAATVAQKEAFDEERKRLTKARDDLSARYHTSEAARKIMEREASREREDAIAASSVANNVCFDDRMRDNWNRDSGYAGASEARPRVDGSVSGTTK